jgi:hypothetical protein
MCRCDTSAWMMRFIRRAVHLRKNFSNDVDVGRKRVSWRIGDHKRFTDFVIAGERS